jgi:hypothetical protein
VPSKTFLRLHPLTHTYTHTHTHNNIHANKQTHTQTSKHTRKHTHTHKYIQANTQTHMQTHTYTHVHTYTHTHANTHANANARGTRASAELPSSVFVFLAGHKNTLAFKPRTQDTSAHAEAVRDVQSVDGEYILNFGSIRVLPCRSVVFKALQGRKRLSKRASKW